MKSYLAKSKKSTAIRELLEETLEILESVGIPVVSKTLRGREKMAMSFLAVSGVKKEWREIRSIESNYDLTTGQIIKFINLNFEEEIKKGSYDNIRRKDLKLLTVANLVENSDSKGRDINDPTRGYALNPDFRQLLRSYKTESWEQNVSVFNQSRESLAEALQRKRNLAKIPVSLPNGKALQLSLGDHNLLQKAIIEEFLPRFGGNSSVLYVGDTTNKSLHLEEAKLKELNFFELSHDKLPDVVAYLESKNWLFMIEAVHSSGPISEIRMLELKKLLTTCPADLIFVTAFLTRTQFKKWAADIAWESEVWIADNPDHMIHFNGHKFLGAY
jgi:hypothetical protein